MHGTYGPNRNPRSRRGERGLSLIEALIALALLLIVAVGVLPLFIRSMANNASGSEGTQSANYARFQIEELSQLPFNNDAVAITAGNQLLFRDDLFSGDASYQGDEAWDAVGTADRGYVLWERTTRVRQFSLNGVLDNDADNVIDGLVGLEDDNDDGEFDNPLAAGTDPAFVHFKELSVELASPRDDPTNRGPGPIGAHPTYRVRTFRAF